MKFFTFSFMFFSILALGLKFEVSAQWGGGGGDYSISIIQWHQNIWNVFPIWDTYYFIYFLYTASLLRPLGIREDSTGYILDSPVRKVIDAGLTSIK